MNGGGAESRALIGQSLNGQWGLMRILLRYLWPHSDAAARRRMAARASVAVGLMTFSKVLASAPLLSPFVPVGCWV